MQIQGAPQETTTERMHELLKVFSDPVRLRILGRLAEGPAGVDELASAFDIDRVSLPLHLHVLKQGGMVEEPSTGTLRLSLRPIRAFLRATAPRAPEAQFAEGVPEESRSILRRFFDGAVLRAIPAQRRMKDIVFEEILRRLPLRPEYAEKELNELLKAIHPDFCTIRRELVDGKYMERTAGIYRLTEKGQEVAAGR